MQKFLRFFSLWFPPILWMGLIFFLSDQPGLKITEGPLDFWLRKAAHIGEYAVLFLLLYRALSGSFRLKIFNLYLISAALAFIYAVSDEFHQLFVPLREGQFTDLAFDLFGILLAAVTARVILVKLS